MSTVGELLHSFNTDDILKVLFEKYPDEVRSEAGYRKVIKELLIMQPVNTDMQVLLIQGIFEDDGESYDYVHVAGIENGVDTRYALDFTEWAKWLAMPVVLSPDNKREVLPVEQLAHCLFEMTFSGFDQANIQDKCQDMVDTIEQIKEDINKGNKIEGAVYHTRTIN